MEINDNLPFASDNRPLAKVFYDMVEGFAF
jgi:hypothetical protein